MRSYRLVPVMGFVALVERAFAITNNFERWPSVADCWYGLASGAAELAGFIVLLWLLDRVGHENSADERR
jgi:hypothetical protein